MASHRADAHNSSAAPTNRTGSTASSLPKPEKVGRPSFDLDQSTDKWAYFKTRWTTYKTATGITGGAVQIQLMETCSESLRFAMFQSDPQIGSKSEDLILAAMKQLSVKEENVMVSCVNLHAFKQESNEPCRNFAARLRGQAELCNFVEKCTNCQHDVRYTDRMVRDALIRGLYDQDIQREVLGLENQEMLLEPLLKLLEAKEVGKRTQANILGQTNAAMSSYRQNQRNQQQPPPVKCTYCGKQGHGKNDGPGRNSMQIRREKCKAFNHLCEHCNKKGHYSTLCRRRNDPTFSPASAAAAAIEQEPVYQEMCCITVIENPASHDEEEDETFQGESETEDEHFESCDEGDEQFPNDVDDHQLDEDSDENNVDTELGLVSLNSI